jgi:hypothetical protein
MWRPRLRMARSSRHTPGGVELETCRRCRTHSESENGNDLARSDRTGTERAAVGDSLRHNLGRREFSNAHVSEIRDKDIPQAVDRQRLRRVERRVGCQAAVADEALGPGPRNSGDHSGGGIHFADNVVIGDVQIPAAVERNAGRRANLGCRCLAAISAGAGAPVSGDRGYRAVGGNLAHTVVTAVGEIQIACTVQS